MKFKDLNLKTILKNIIKWLFIIIVFLLTFYFSFSYFIKNLKEPKLNADWEFGQEKTPSVLINKEENKKDFKIIIKNLRDFSWTKKKKEEQKKYIDYEFKLSDIVGMKMGVSHFSAFSGIAHVFIIFDLKDGNDFGLSIESRREVGEEFSLISGLKYDYELIYILATEDDLLNLREKRNEEIYLYPIRTTSEKVRKIFLGLSGKINSLNKKAEFYHLFSYNCTGLMADEVEKVSDKRFPFVEKTFFPGYADKAIFNLGLIDTDKDNFEDVKKEFLVDFNKK